MNQELNPKGNGWALLPFLLFIVIYLGAGLILQAHGVGMAFYGNVPRGHCCFLHGAGNAG